MGRNNRPNNLDENRGETMTFTFSNTLNYLKTIHGKHSINALLGTETISSKSSITGGSRQNFDNSTDPFRYLDYGSSTNAYSFRHGSRLVPAILLCFGNVRLHE